MFFILIDLADIDIDIDTDIYLCYSDKKNPFITVKKILNTDLRVYVIMDDIKRKSSN